MAAFEFDWKNIFGGTMDTEATMNKVMRICKQRAAAVGNDAEFSGCVDHQLELTTGIAFSDIPESDQAMKAARKLCRHFKESTLA